MKTPHGSALRCPRLVIHKLEYFESRAYQTPNTCIYAKPQVPPRYYSLFSASSLSSLLSPPTYVHLYFKSTISTSTSHISQFKQPQYPPEPLSHKSQSSHTILSTFEQARDFISRFGAFAPQEFTEWRPLRLACKLRIAALPQTLL